MSDVTGYPQQYEDPYNTSQPFQPPRPPKPSWPTAAVVLVIILSFTTLISCGVAITASNSNQTPAAGARTTATVTKTVAAEPAAPAAAATTAPPAAPPGPLTSFSDGTYEVGAAAGLVAPGKYRTTVPTSSNNCYWERLKGLSGQFSDIIANGNAGPGTPVVVTIATSDKGFAARGCGTWTKA